MKIMDSRDEFLSDEIKFLIEDAQRFLDIKEEVKSNLMQLFLTKTTNN